MKNREKNDKNEQSLRDLCDNVRFTDLCVMGMPEGKERKGQKKIFEKTMVENFSHMMENNRQIQEAQ